MRNSVKMSKFFQFLLLSVLVACSTNPVEKIQGVYVADKNSLQELLQKEIDSDDALASNLLDIAIENAVFEFKIQGDSINGLIFLAGESTLINSKVISRDDSIVINVENNEAFLIPNQTGLKYVISKSDKSVQLIKAEQTDLSEETKQAIVEQIKAEKERKEFEESLGKWQRGDIVDEFGDDTGESFVYCVVRGSHENSISMDNEVYVKASIEEDALYFQIFNSTLTLKENFPDIEYGTIKIKFPDGTVKSERIFFYHNMAIESPKDEKNLIYNYLIDNDGELKLLIDLSTASDYYSDKYQFTLQKNNLKEILD